MAIEKPFPWNLNNSQKRNADVYVVRAWRRGGRRIVIWKASQAPPELGPEERMGAH